MLPPVWHNPLQIQKLEEMLPMAENGEAAAAEASGADGEAMAARAQEQRVVRRWGGGLGALGGATAVWGVLPWAACCRGLGLLLSLLTNRNNICLAFCCPSRSRCWRSWGGPCRRPSSTAR